VLNTATTAGVAHEGRIEVDYVDRRGRYPDGSAWRLREPRYRLVDLAYGDLHPETVMKPRIGPALFGRGLLEAVPSPALEAVARAQPRAQRGVRSAGRFGWQADVATLEDQTERALQREMGLTTAARPFDDCTAAQLACRNAVAGGAPEMRAEYLQAMVTFERELAVPGPAPNRAATGARLFAAAGCGICHRDTLPADLPGGRVSIASYTDLLRHDLGEGLADRRVDGRRVPSPWRTAPQWGLQHDLARGEPSLMHDGRARTVEEAVLWHDGQARESRRRFAALSAAQRAALLDWVSSL